MFLRQEQRLLLDQLGRRDPLFANIYFGGLRAFADDTNPYRFQLAAHARTKARQAGIVCLENS
jgi:hypothetical protein